MVPAFTRVAKLLSPHGPEPVVESIPSFPSGWKFPTGLGSSDPPATADPATTAFVNELLDPTYFDTQPFSSGSSDMPTSTHSSTGTAHSQLIQPPTCPIRCTVSSPAISCMMNHPSTTAGPGWISSPQVPPSPCLLQTGSWAITLPPRPANQSVHIAQKSRVLTLLSWTRLV
jgi:hypothetical protein